MRLKVIAFNVRHSTGVALAGLGFALVGTAIAIGVIASGAVLQGIVLFACVVAIPAFALHSLANPDLTPESSERFTGEPWHASEAAAEGPD